MSPHPALASCPFCGEQPTMSAERPFVVHCDMRGSETARFNNDGLAAKRWNTRTPRLYTREDLERYRNCPKHLEPDVCRECCGTECPGFAESVVPQERSGVAS